MTATDSQSLNISALLSRRAHAIDASGIRKVFDLAAHLKNPINLSIGQPDFPVPQVIKDAAIAAIQGDKNGYTPTQGCHELIDAIWRRLEQEFGWPRAIEHGLSAIATSGTSGGIFLALLCLLDEGDEAIIPDPYFVMYPAMGPLTTGKMVAVDTYPDFRLTAERIERAITQRTKCVLLNSPGNPTGVVLSQAEIRDIVDLCRAKNLLIISDEIYDEFTFSESREHGRFPSPASFTRDCLLVRGFGKTYGCTGWRLGYVAGPHDLVQAMARLQQYSFVCAPSMAQHGVAKAFDVDMQPWVDRFEKRRTMMLEAFAGIAEVTQPGGAFYGFVEVPKRLNLSATQFVEQAIANNVLIIPGKVFSHRDTHFRLSFAQKEEVLAEGLSILRRLMQA